MSKRILVPIEGSGRDAQALEMALQIAHQLMAEVVLVHIAPTFFNVKELVAAEQRLDEYTRALRDSGIEAHFLIEYGDASAGIANIARRQDAQMIVLAPEHRALLGTLWHPRVSSDLLTRAATPLFILPDIGPSQGAPELLNDPEAKVFLALDGSANAEAAMPLAIQLAQAYQRTLVLVRVVAPVFIFGAGVEAQQAQRDAQYAEEVETHRYLVETRKRVAAETHLTVETIELVGPVAEHLTRLAASHKGSALVMGTHGRGGLKRAVLGSIAADVLNRATSPLIIVPPRPADGTGTTGH